VITIQREQYGVTVHLFIGTGRNPDEITFTGRLDPFILEELEFTK
jgi:hypothetical protein